MALRCGACGRPNPKVRCSKCRLVYYCDEEVCASRDWIAQHRDEEEEEDLDPVNLVYEMPETRGKLYIGGIDALSESDSDKYDAIISALPRDRVTDEALNNLLPRRAEHMRVDVHDEPKAPIERYFDETAQFIDDHLRAGHRVLVHCHAGVSRSVTLVLNYLVNKIHAFRSVDEALRFIQKSRPGAGPNRGFLKKLNNK